MANPCFAARGIPSCCAPEASQRDLCVSISPPAATAVLPPPLPPPPPPPSPAIAVGESGTSKTGQAPTTDPMAMGGRELLWRPWRRQGEGHCGGTYRCRYRYRYHGTGTGIRGRGQAMLNARLGSFRTSDLALHAVRKATLRLTRRPSASTLKAELCAARAQRAFPVAAMELPVCRQRCCRLRRLPPRGSARR